MLLVLPGHEPRHVDERDDGDVERVTEADEPRALQRGVDVERAGVHPRLVADDADRTTVESPEPGDEVPGVPLGDLEERPLVDDTVDDVDDVVRLLWLVRDDVRDVGVALRVVPRLDPWRVLDVVLRQVRQQASDLVERLLLGGLGEVRDARLRGVGLRATQLLEGDLLARDGLDDLGPGDHHVARLLDHEDEVRDRG